MITVSPTTLEGRYIIQIVPTGRVPERSAKGTTTLYALASDGTLWELRDYCGYNPDQWLQVTALPQ